MYNPADEITKVRTELIETSNELLQVSEELLKLNCNLVNHGISLLQNTTPATIQIHHNLILYSQAITAAILDLMKFSQEISLRGFNLGSTDTETMDISRDMIKQGHIMATMSRRLLVVASV